MSSKLCWGVVFFLRVNLSAHYTILEVATNIIHAQKELNLTEVKHLHVSVV